MKDELKIKRDAMRIEISAGANESGKREVEWQ